MVAFIFPGRGPSAIVERILIRRRPTRHATWTKADREAETDLWDLE